MDQVEDRLARRGNDFADDTMGHELILLRFQPKTPRLPNLLARTPRIPHCCLSE
jgi:hypothetical protein